MRGVCNQVNTFYPLHRVAFQGLYEVTPNGVPGDFSHRNKERPRVLSLHPLPIIIILVSGRINLDKLRDATPFLDINEKTRLIMVRGHAIGVTLLE